MQNSPNKSLSNINELTVLLSCFCNMNVNFVLYTYMCTVIVWACSVYLWCPLFKPRLCAYISSATYNIKNLVHALISNHKIFDHLVKCCLVSETDIYSMFLHYTRHRKCDTIMFVVSCQGWFSHHFKILRIKISKNDFFYNSYCWHFQ